ncbi:MAG: MFS transporter [Pseudomonadales bacterium]
MPIPISSIGALFLSVAILLTGHGLQLTIAPLYASELGWSVTMIGFLGSAYFAGFVLGCLTIPRLVARAGHIRVFAVLSATATTALLLLALLDLLEGWLFARLLTGWSIAGIYMVIESWLNERTSPENRGTVLSIYTVLTLAAVALGQQLLGLGMPSADLILLGAILLSIGSIPLGLTRSPAPQPIAEVRFQFLAVYRHAHVAIVGAFLAGFVTSGFWVLGPLMARSLELADSEIGWFLSITILGGALLQIPIGRLSDKVDRRRVIAAVALLGFSVCVVAFSLGSWSVWILLGAMFLFGGTAFPLYSLCLAHANDNSELPLIEIGSVILLMHSAGSIIGPLVIAPLMAFHAGAYFVIAAIILLGLSAWSYWRVREHEVARKYFEAFPTVPKTTQEVMEIHDEVMADEEAESLT